MFPLVQHFPLMKQKFSRVECVSLDQSGSCSNTLQLVNILLFFKHFSFSIPPLIDFMSPSVPPLLCPFEDRHSFEST